MVMERCLEASGAKTITGKSLIVLALLIVAGFLGNYFTVPLFFGADFLFGGVAVFVAIYFYGLGWGMLAAILVNSYTCFLWGHPFGFINFTSEALFVGFFLKRGHRNILALDWLFWVFLGMPLAWFYHAVVMHFDAGTAAFIMLKQAINGISNVLLANLAISYLPFGRIFKRPRFAPNNTLQASLFNLLVMMVLVPALLLTTLQAREERANLEAGVMTELHTLSANVRIHLRSWHQAHVEPLRMLASLAGESLVVPSKELQHQTEILKKTFPDFVAVQVDDSNGRAVAFSPKVNARGESTVGVDYSDRAWFKDVQAKRQPVVSEVLMGRTVSIPVVAISVPVIRENRRLGCCVGTLDLRRLQKMIESYRPSKADASLTLTDAQNRVIASTTPGRTPMQSWNRKSSGVFQTLGSGIYRWSPHTKGLRAMTQWQKSYYVRETSVGPELQWKLTAEAPVAPLQRTLYSIYVKNLAVMACLITLDLLLSFILSRGLSSPLTQLKQVTADLPEKLSKDLEIDWPASSSEEIDGLIGNFKSMAEALKANFHRLKVQSDGLKETAEALSLRESYLTAIIENQPGLLWLKDKEGRFLSVNHAFVRSCSRSSPEDVTGKTDLDIWPAELAEKYRGDDSEVITGRKLTVVEERIFDQGVVKWFQTFKTPVFAEDGQVLGTCGFALDVTERRHTEDAVLRAKDDWERTFDAVPDLIAILDRDWRFVRVNKAMAAKLGVLPAECIGLTCYHAVHGTSEPPVFCPHGQLLADGMEHTAEFYEERLRGDFAASVSPLLGPGGELTGSVHVCRDITERRRAEEERKTLQDQLIQAQKLESVGRLAGGIAHDFNNMLGVIFGHAEMAMEQIEQSHALFADLTEIRKAAERSADLTRQLLAFARRQTISPRILDLNETVEGMLKMLRRLIGEHIDLAWLPAKVLWPVKVDPSQIDQVLANLCVNASDAISGVGEVRIETGNTSFDQDYCAWHPGAVTGEYVVLTVRDNGCGMDKETLCKIFEPFYTTKGVGEGTGLGLATVYGIVKQNNGYIDVYSEPGEGTAFKIHLPRCEEQSVEEKPSLLLKRDLRGKETVLLVEDEESILAMGKVILQRQGYEVLATKSPAEALRIAQSYPGPIHLLISDVVMPEMNGKDLRDRLVEVKPGFKSIFMSGYTSDVIANHGILYEGIDFLQKPFSVQALLEKVRGALDR